jgi:glutamate-1-semialdehyde 2,1-aminomutase
MNKNFETQKRAQSCIPGMTQLLSKRPDLFSFGRWPGYYSKAKGATVWDLDGKEYLDMSIAGIGACVLGYSDDEVDEAVIRAIKDGVASSLNCLEEVELAETLCDIHPWAGMARFTRSGGEAMSMAVRIARAHTGRDKIAFCGYHGWSDWYLAANLGDTEALDGHLLPGLRPAGVPRGLSGTALPFRYNHPEELRSIVEQNRNSLAAIVIEPVRNEMPEPGFIEEIRDIADRIGAVFIIDEISAGFRYCLGGSHLVLHSVSPDIAVFSKALGNGYAIAAVIGRESVMQSVQRTFISSTNWTERIGPVAALATIRKYDREKVHKHFTYLGQKIKNGWLEAGRKYGLPISVSGMDAMAHFSIDHPEFLSLKAYFVEQMLEHDMLASNLCYLMASHTEDHADRYLSACDDAFKNMAAALEQKDLDSRIKGAPSISTFKRLA